MRHLIRRRPVLAGAALAVAVTFAPVAAQQAERVDLDAIYKIKDEGFARSQVMDIMSWLTDVYGPRLTNSPGFRKSGDWAVKQMTSWGLTNVKLQPFGPFGRGWSNDKFYMMATTPGGSFAVIGHPQAWTSGTTGAVSGDAVFATIDTPADLETWKGKLKGKVLLATAMPDVPALFEAPAQRYSAEQLAALESEIDAVGRGGRGGRVGGPGRAGGPGGGGSFAQTRTQFLKDEGVLAILTPGRGTGGTVFVGGGGSREANAPATVPGITVAVEHYGRILRTLQKNQPVTIDLDVKNTLLRRHHVVQRHGRDCRHRQGRRSRHARRPLRLLARRHRRDRQRRRFGGDDGSDAHPQADGSAAAAHGTDRPLGRGRTGPHRFARSTSPRRSPIARRWR